MVPKPVADPGMQALHDNMSDKVSEIIHDYQSGLLFLSELVEAIVKYRDDVRDAAAPGVLDKVIGMRYESPEQAAERKARADAYQATLAADDDYLF